MPDKPDIAVVEDVWGQPFDRLARRLRVVRHPDAWAEPDRLPELVAGAKALVVRNRTKVDRTLLAGLPELRVVARAGVGLENIDLAAADELGVVVVAARGANATSVAEHTIGLALAVARGVVRHDGRTREGGWDRTAGRELAGRTWGLLGFGATGAAVARLAAGLGMSVVAYDPYVEADGEVRLAGLTETVRAADVLSVHLPATTETRGLLDAELLSELPEGAILVSVGRGETVDEDALADALESGRLYGAALDVRAEEPPMPGRLERLDNVVLTPHVAGITVESQHHIARLLADDIEAVLDGRTARHAVGRTPR